MSVTLGQDRSSVGEDRETRADRSPPGTVQHRHVAALDGIRGLALLFILIDHLLNTNDFAANPVVQAVLDFREMTWTGVYLFFALSGFLITGILYDTLDTDNFFSAFYGRRVLRIFPLYYGVLLLLALLTIPLHFNWQGQQWMLWTYTQNLPFHPQFEANPAYYINLRHFWSLAVEEQFYFVWPLVIFWMRTWKRVMIAAIVGTLLSIAFRVWLLFHGQESWFHTSPSALDALLPGGMLALLIRSRFKDTVLRWSTPIFLLSMAFMLWDALRPPYFHPSRQYAFHPNRNLLLGTIGLTIISIGYTALIASTLKARGLAQKFFSHPFLCFFGTYSYGLYVIHYRLDAAFTQKLRLLFQSHHIPLLLAVLLAGLLIAAASTALAYASYHLYETRFLRLKRLFPYRRTLPQPDSAC